VNETAAEIQSTDPERATAFHARAVEHAGRGEHSLAADLFGRAAALRPNVAAIHVDLAEAFRNMGDGMRAVGCCRIALKFQPDVPDALNTLGLALQQIGRRDEAIETFRSALELRPDSPTLHNNVGVVFRELGRTGEAIESFRQAAALDPGVFRVHTNLGMALLHQGRADEALEPLREAVRLEPEMAILHQNLAAALRIAGREDEAMAARREAVRLDPDVADSPPPNLEWTREEPPEPLGDPCLALLHHRLGDALQAQGRYVDARAAYLEALRLDLRRASTHVQIGASLRREGQLDEALPWLEMAVAMAPEEPAYWERLAQLQSERDEPGEALRCWERVRALEPAERASTHVALGWALQEEGRQGEALEHYQQAARLEPGSAAPHVHIGGVHAQAGQMAGAEAAFRAALRVQPRSAEAAARLATLLRNKLPDADRTAMESLLADPALEPAARARLLFGLAHVLDARGEYDRAADCLRQANAFSLTPEGAAGPRGYDPAEHARFVDGVIRAFGAGFCANMAGQGLPTRQPVFIFGLPRSGTTLVEQVLASHPQVHGAGELRLGRRPFEAIPALLGRRPHEGPLDCVAGLDAGRLRRLAERHLEQLGVHDGGRAARVVDKMPDNYLYLGLLAAMFPAATFIHCRRDLRDVALSCWMTDFRTIRWANHPAHIAARFHDYRRLMDHWRAALPVVLHEVDYEDTVAGLEGVARRLMDACGLDWDPACLDFHRTQRTIRTASLAQVRQPIYRTSVSRWRHYEKALANLFEALPIE
jgi:tetratricopeptide (TPR) repeat protein